MSSSGLGARCFAVWALGRREIVRFTRQRSRFIGALAQPLLFWVLFGAGLHGSFRAPDWAAQTMSYQEYFFPGIAVLILLFTAIFSSISIIEDRHEGFLQGVLVAPVSKLELVLGKVLGGTLLAVLQAVLFLIVGGVMSGIGLAPAMGIQVSVVSAVELVLFMSVIALGLAGLGFMIAWWFDSVQGFHAIMSVVLMPMWLLSGAFFPGDGVGWLSWIVRLNPLTYGVAGIRWLLYAEGSAPLKVVASSSQPAFPTCIAVTLLFAVITVLGGQFVASRTARPRKIKTSK